MNLSVKSKRPIHEELVVEVVSGLRSNTSVEEFSLDSAEEKPSFGDTARGAISAMLEQM